MLRIVSNSEGLFLTIKSTRNLSKNQPITLSSGPSSDLDKIVFKQIDMTHNSLPKRPQQISRHQK